MPPKNGNKKKSKTPAEKEYTLLTFEEMKVKEQKYNNHLTELRKCLGFIDDALLEIYSLNEKQLLQDKWLDFVSCNPLPKPYIPPDLRLYFSKLEYEEQNKSDKSINWLLAVDERSILSQNIYRKDLTRRNLHTKIKESIGLEYNSYISNSLKIFFKVQSFLDNDVEVSKCPISVLHDIVEYKSVIKKEIMSLFNRFTYRIVSQENAEMKSIDAISAEYFFESKSFEMHIWCLKNVAIRMSNLRDPCLEANFHSIKVILQIPLKMLKENLLIRALHLNFDHLSEIAKSFKQEITVSTEDLNAGILDLHECLLNEWTMQLKIQDKIHHEMIEKRLEYEEKIKQYEEQMEKNKGRKKDEKPAKKIIKAVKPTNEPPVVGIDNFPDTYEEFLKEEQKQYEHFIKTVYNPETLDLTPDEVNLKKHSILGGIYHFNYVEKPLHYDFESFNMTWHHNDARLLIDEKVNIAKPLNESTKYSVNDATKRMTITGTEKPHAAADIECQFFVVSFSLPENLCYWGEPIACHFETTVKPVKEDLQSEILKSIKSERKSKIQLSQTNLFPKERSDLSTFRTLDSFSQPDINTLLASRESSSCSFTVKRKRLASSQQYVRGSYFKDSLVNSLLQKKKSDNITLAENFFIKDFFINNILTNSQIRHMEKYIIPRIISSYKFPKEIHLEDLEMYSKKPKGKGGKILRQKTENFQTELSDRQFTFNDRQNKPERIFATYPKVEPLGIISNLKPPNLDEEPEEPQTFAELLQIISNIKKKYRLRLHQTTDLKPFEPPVKTYNKRIRQMQRKKELATLTSLMKGTSNNNSRSGSIFRASTKRSISKRSMDKPKREDVKLSKQYVNELHETDIQEKSSFEEDINEVGSKEAPAIDHKLPESKPVTYSHWTTKYILKSEFDRENHKIVLHTDRLGIFGFAFKRYEHFPFKSWSMEPSENDPENEVIFTLDTQYVRCVLRITGNGISGYVTELSKTYLRNPKMYLVIEEPIKDYREFKELFKAKNLNIFAEHDACYYIENGYFSEKHLSNELHIYSCMSVHSTQMHFNSSQWNRLAKRRDIILQFKQYKDSAENLVEVRLTPGEAFFVEIQELCSEDLNDIKLEYNLTWRNIESYSDLHHLIVAMYPTATELRCRNSKLICCIRDLLSEIRPLSFS